MSSIEKGIVTTITGSVSAITLTGKQRDLKIGDHVCIDDIVTTTMSACIEIKFPDGSLISLGLNS